MEIRDLHATRRETLKRFQKFQTVKYGIKGTVASIDGQIVTDTLGRKFRLAELVPDVGEDDLLKTYQNLGQQGVKVETLPGHSKVQELLSREPVHRLVPGELRSLGRLVRSPPPTSYQISPKTYLQQPLQLV